VLQCVAVCCSVLQCVAVCRSVSQCGALHLSGATRIVGGQRRVGICIQMSQRNDVYGVATVSRIDQMIGLFCRILSLL